jgi:hypothetical protein
MSTPQPLERVELSELQSTETLLAKNTPHS